MQIVIAPDSFKGTATTHQAGEFLAQGAAKALEQAGITAEVTVVPMADGGEGTASAFTGQRILCPTTNANGRLIEASYVLDPDTATAYIDIASASGLPEVEGALSPLSADTYGTGVLIADASSRGAQRIVLCLGGSATTDGGAGILVALGAPGLDAQGKQLAPGGGPLSSLANIDTAQLNVPAAAAEWILLTDVPAPALGPTGSAAVFAPQKGATPEDVTILEEGLTVLANYTGIDPMIPGMGAAGATPLSIFWLSELIHGSGDHVHLMPGARVVADAMGLAELISTADLVITGEGKFDSQSLTGKVVGTIAQLISESESNPALAIVAGKLDTDVPADALAHELITAEVEEQLINAGESVVKDFLARRP